MRMREIPPYFRVELAREEPLQQLDDGLPEGDRLLGRLGAIEEQMHARPRHEAARAFRATQELDVIDELGLARVGETERIGLQRSRATRADAVRVDRWTARNSRAPCLLALDPRRFCLHGKGRNIPIEPVDPKTTAVIADVDLGRRDRLLPHDFRAPGASDDAVTVRGPIREGSQSYLTSLRVQPKSTST